MSHVLIVEDEKVLRMTFAQFLEDDGHEVHAAANFLEARRFLDEQDYDVVVTDIVLGGKTGIDLLGYIQDGQLACQVIMITGDPSVNTASEAVRLGAFDYVAKPVTGPQIKKVVRQALDKKLLAEERDHYAARIDKYRRDLETIFNSVNEGIITVDSEMRINHVNTAARKIFDIDGRELRDQTLEGLFPPDCEIARKSLEATASSHEPVKDTELTLDRGGQPARIVIVNTAPLVDPKGAFEGAVLVARDVTRIAALEEQLKGARQSHDIIGKSGKMRAIFDLIDDVAETDSTVLICGESGTGKELVAVALHQCSPRVDGPLVKVNCAALHEDLLESELFGHVKGAFTGAVKDRVGRFESADGGTIFLDEIGDISARLQLRLLRVLQEREFERVGDSTPIRADVRVVAATNQDLAKKIQAGEFRQDLYYRLNVVKIDVPPLRERREDIPLLVDHFCERLNALLKKNIEGLSPETMEVFMRYPWLGNIRELENCMERAFIVCRESHVLPRHLPAEILERNGGLAAGRLSGSAASGANIAKARILDILTQTDWNVAKSARQLGIARNTLYQKMKAFELNRPSGL